MDKRQLIDAVREVNDAYTWMMMHDLAEKANDRVEAIEAFDPSFLPPFKEAVEGWDPVDDLAYLLESDVRIAFASGLSRQEALFLLRLLAHRTVDSITVCKGVVIYELDLRNRYNEAHPDDYIYADDYIPLSPVD